MQGTHYHAIELNIIKDALCAGEKAGTPLNETLAALGVRLARSPKGIRKVAGYKGFLTVVRKGCAAHANGVLDDDETVDTSFEKQQRAAMCAADAIFQQRMRKAIESGRENARDGIVLKPCTESPRTMRPEPLIFIRSSGGLAADQGEQAGVFDRA